MTDDEKRTVEAWRERRDAERMREVHDAALALVADAAAWAARAERMARVYEVDLDRERAAMLAALRDDGPVPAAHERTDGLLDLATRAATYRADVRCWHELARILRVVLAAPWSVRTFEFIPEPEPEDEERDHAT